MKYVITVKSLTETDVSFDCPYGNLCCDDDDYNFHLNLLVSDIESLDEVSSVSETNNQICVNTDLSKSELLEKMKPFFQREFCYVRFSKIELEACA